MLNTLYRQLATGNTAAITTDSNGNIVLIWFELAALAAFFYFLFWNIPLVYFNPDFPRTEFIILLLSFFVYLLILSPLIHGHSREARGLGSLKTFFIKTDSLSSDIKPFTFFWIFCLFVFTTAFFIKSYFIDITIDWPGFLLKYGLYIVSASLQDAVVFSFLFLRIQALTNYYLPDQNTSSTMLIASFVLATVFGLAHLPNWQLALFTTPFAFGLALLFSRSPNLFLVAMSHAFFGAALHRIFQLHMKCGHFYGNYSTDAAFVRKVIPGLEALINNRW